MNRDTEHSIAHIGRALIKLFLLGTVLLGSSVVNAALITGSMGLDGNYSATNTTINFTSVSGEDGLGDLASTIGVTGTINNGSFTYNPFTPPQNDLLVIDGFQFDITSLNIAFQSPSFLVMDGNGTLSKAGFTDTAATWDFTTQAVGGTYSLTITTVVPVPAAVWLFGSGLIGLIALARRKSA